MFEMIPVALAQAANKAVEEPQGIGKMVEYVVKQFPLWIAAALIFILSIFLAKLVKNMVENKIAEKGIEEEHKGVQTLGGRMASAGVLVVGITAALKIAGIDVTSIVAAGAFGIGFALRDLIMNFLAGIMILVSRHFTMGDFIRVGGTMGKIIEIQTRATVLKAIDGTKVVVPNAELFTKVVTSFTSNPFRRFEVAVGVDYGTDLRVAVEKCYSALKSIKGILAEPKPMVILTEFADSSINLKVRGWVESKSGWLKKKSELVIAIKKEFDQAGISIPWPIRTIHYGKDLAAEAEKKLEEGVKEAMVEKEAQAKAQATGEQATVNALTQAPAQKIAVPVPVEAAVQTEVPKPPIQ